MVCSNHLQVNLCSWGILFKLLYRKNAPSFTLDEAKQAWNYIVEHFPAACLGGNKVDPVIEAGSNLISNLNLFFV
mgnify:CR=1 FL=1